MGKILDDFLLENKDKFIRLIFGNGYQLRGRLIRYDSEHMLIDTTAYDSPPITVPYTAVTTFVPAKK